jgi:2-dehydro-3-deoxyphosphooctonate aldolase (KDO 8-P synthase)
MTISWSQARLPVLVAGPCALEAGDVNVRVAEVLADLANHLGLFVLFKGSFDKANRSRASGLRGIGLEPGLKALERVRLSTGLPILTDVHEVHQVATVAAVVDAIQVPAFLCRQTDLLRTVGASGKLINIKKGQWMAPEGMIGAVEKVRSAGANEIAVTERGTFLGYGDLVVDMRSFRRMKMATGASVLFDATHSVQRPGWGPDGATGGSRDDVAPLLYAAAAAGADGFFVETHPQPDVAPSDGESMVPLTELPSLIERTLEIWMKVHEPSPVGA